MSVTNVYLLAATQQSPCCISKIMKLKDHNTCHDSWVEARNDENNGLHGKNNLAYFPTILGRVCLSLWCTLSPALCFSICYTSQAGAPLFVGHYSDVEVSYWSQTEIFSALVALKILFLKNW